MKMIMTTLAAIAFAAAVVQGGAAYANKYDNDTLDITEDDSLVSGAIKGGIRIVEYGNALDAGNEALREQTEREERDRQERIREKETREREIRVKEEKEAKDWEARHWKEGPF
jgi:hypothetical protein